MLLDPLTLMALTAIIATTVGLLLLFAWVQNRNYLSLALWGGGMLVGAAAAALLLARNIAPDFVSINIANALLAACYGLIWSGGRAFASRPIRIDWCCAGSVGWLVACSFPWFYGSTQFRMILMSVIVASYTFATARELWAQREERLISRYPAVIWLCFHAVFHLGRIVAAIVNPMPPGAQLVHTPLFTIITFESLINVIAIGFLMLSMAKERSELIQRQAASIDELTGAASRRAFLSEGERKLRAALNEQRPAALLLFDLDHFKTINDSFGHQAGDRVLQAFAKRATEVLRPGDLFGRIGGEEFAALLTDGPARGALAVAERFRGAVEDLEVFEGRERIRLSVSVGVATCFGSPCDLGDLLKQADQALYGAKAAGRNQVQQRKLRAVPLLRAV